MGEGARGARDKSMRAPGRNIEVGEAVRKLNPHIFRPDQDSTRETVETTRSIRQDSKPLLNGLETEWLAVLVRTLPPGTQIHSQAWRVKLANGSWYKVDHCAFVAGQWTAWECKELKGKNSARGILALKTAAHQFPEVQWFLVTKQNGQFTVERVLP